VTRKCDGRRGERGKFEGEIPVREIDTRGAVTTLSAIKHEFERSAGEGQNTVRVIAPFDDNGRTLHTDGFERACDDAVPSVESCGRARHRSGCRCAECFAHRENTVNHVHPASECVLTNGESGQIDGGLGKGRELGRDAEIREDDP